MQLSTRIKILTISFNKYSMSHFLTHECEQVLRFSQASTWDDLSEARKVQFGFNMGIVALGLDLTKEEGFWALSNACEGIISMTEFREHMKMLIKKHKISVDEAQIARPF